MRLRLRIERNQLPPINALWPVTDAALKQTVAQFVEAVNTAFPLEGDKWGLEDYIIEIGGYECLHYHALSAVCKDEDEVVIRPLTWAEVRARTLTGRSQISKDGRKLEDGVPFGRPALRAPVRPEIHIPERKRKREAEDEDVQLGAVHKKPQLFGDDDDDDDDADDDQDEEDDEDFAPLGLLEDVPLQDVGESSSACADSYSDTDSTSDSDRDSDSDEASSSGDESSDDDDDGSSSESSGSSTDTGSSDDSDSDSSKDSGPSDYSTGKNTAPLVVRGLQPQHTQPGNTKQHQKQQQHSGSGQQRSRPELPLPESGDRLRNTNVRDSTDADETKLTKTQQRNLRRRDATGLKFEKDRGTFGPKATLADYRKWRETGVVPSETMPSITRTPGQEPEQSLLSNHPQTPVDEIVNATDTSSTHNDASIKPADNDEDEGVRALAEAKKRALLAIGITLDNDGADEPAPSAAVPTPTFKLSAAQRTIYNSLGLPPPKSAEEHRALQERLQRGKEKAAIAPHVPAASTEQPTEGGENPVSTDDALRRISLSAIECVQENTPLVEPAFPFDRKQDLRVNKLAKKQTKKKRSGKGAGGLQAKRQRRDTDNNYYDDNYDNDQDDQDYSGYDYSGYDAYDEYYDSNAKYVDSYNEGGDFLDYDGTGSQPCRGNAANEEDAQASDGAAIAPDNTEYSTPAAKPVPALPEDTTTLPVLDVAEARAGDMIVYAELVCSFETRFQPTVLNRTCMLLHPAGEEDLVGEGMKKPWRVNPARRDMAKRKVLKNGEVERFGMEGPQFEEEQDEGPPVVDLAGVGLVRLLKRDEVLL